MDILGNGFLLEFNSIQYNLEKGIDINGPLGVIRNNFIRDNGLGQVYLGSEGVYNVSIHQNEFYGNENPSLILDGGSITSQHGIKITSNLFIQGNRPFLSIKGADDHFFQNNEFKESELVGISPRNNVKTLKCHSNDSICWDESSVTHLFFSTDLPVNLKSPNWNNCPKCYPYSPCSSLLDSSLPHSDCCYCDKDVACLNSQWNAGKTIVLDPLRLDSNVSGPLSWCPCYPYSPCKDKNQVDWSNCYCEWNDDECRIQQNANGFNIRPPIT